MASTNGRHYRDHRRVDERLDDERRNNTNARNNGLLGSGGNGSATGSAGNSLSLEALFINGVGAVRESGSRYDHRRPATSTQDIIRLDYPRPDVLRTRNEYVDVTRNATSSRSQHRSSARQSTGPFPATAGRLSVGRMEEGFQLAHRAHSMPLSASSAACSPVMAPVLLDGGSAHRADHCACYIGRPLLSSASTACSRVDFDRVKHAGPSKSAATLSPLSNGCHPSTSSTVSKPPIPGRAIRVSNSSSTRNGAVLLPTSPVISSQPWNSSSNCYDKKNSTGKRANDCCSSSEIDCRRPNGLFESNDCSSSSLMCKYCGRCRCAACTTRRTLPSRWICNNSCLLSSDSVVDALSCMCCVKGCLYHAGANSDDFFDERCSVENSDACAKSSASSPSDPERSLWSCSPFGSANCCLRWGILASATMCLPCIWFYLPMKACTSGVESTYSWYHDHGCRCDRRNVRSEKQHSARSSTRPLNAGDRSLGRRLRRKRSHTLPPELPSIAAAKAAACNGYSCDGTQVTACRSASGYS